MKKIKERETTDRHKFGSAHDSEILKIKIHFSDPKTKVQKENKMYIAGESTMSEAVEEACRNLKIKSLYPLDRCRLVGFDSTTEIIERSFEGREKDQVMSD
jgi:ubiquitin carboxyl-terminal hydrolase 47